MSIGGKVKVIIHSGDPQYKPLTRENDSLHELLSHLKENSDNIV